MKFTEKLLLKLPEPNEFVQVEDLNENFITIDTEIAKITDEETGAQAQLIKHMGEKIESEQGLHKQIRYYEKKLQIKVGDEWVDHKSGAQIALSAVTDFSAKAGDTQVTLNWKDPNDVEIEGAVIAKWAGTRIMRKVGSPPENENDGVIVVNSGIWNQYEINGYIDSGLTNNETYYYSAFAYTTDGVFSGKSDVAVMPIPYVIYGVAIDTTNANPETALTYSDDATGMSGGAASWDNVFPFNQIRPVMLKEKVVQYELQKNDFSKKLDGSPADITSGNDGDVTIEFPKIWWTMRRVGNILFVAYSNAKVDEKYKALAHTTGGVEKDYLYIGAYLGFEQSGKLRSLSGKTPTANKTIGVFRTLAKANGTGYEQMTYYALLMLQVLYLVRYKNRDSQTALGRGYVDGNSAARATGGANTRGLFYGETTGKQQNKFCGIEDFYGNLRYWIDGMFSDANRNILIGNQNFNDTGAGYDNFGQGATANLSGYISDVQGGTETGFIIKAKDGSETTHYADYGDLNASCLPDFGGAWADASHAGAFYLNVFYSASHASATIGARLLAL